MELAYLPDSMINYHHWPVYPSWQENEFKYETKKPNNTSQDIKTDEKNCSICREKKKRLLSQYIKSKQMDCQNKTCIQEEEEEEDNKPEMETKETEKGKQ